ncbi:MAG: type II toxin-antitoxin system HicA family toxin [Candidatus Binatia bacterium]
MKRSEFVRQLVADGCVLARHGAKHDVYVNPATGKKQTVPRHTEIDDTLVKHIRKRLGLSG